MHFTFAAAAALSDIPGTNYIGLVKRLAGTPVGNESSTMENIRGPLYSSGNALCVDRDRPGRDSTPSLAKQSALLGERTRHALYGHPQSIA